MARTPVVGRSTVVAAALAAVLLGGCSSAASSDCSRGLDLDGRHYAGYRAHDVVAGEPLGRGVLPGCDDTPRDGRESGTSVEVVSVPGVDPTRAVALAGVDDALFLAPDLEAGELPGAVSQMLDVAGD